MSAALFNLQGTSSEPSHIWFTTAVVYQQRKDSLSPGMGLAAQSSIGKKMLLSSTTGSQTNKVNSTGKVDAKLILKRAANIDREQPSRNCSEGTFTWPATLCLRLTGS